MILQDLYYEYFSQIKKKKSEEYQKLRDKSENFYNELYEKQSDEDKKLLLNLSDSESEITAFSDTEKFTEGFKYALKLIFECLL